MGEKKKKDKSGEKKPIIVEKLSEEKKTELIYQYSARIQSLENEIRVKSNPINILSDNADNLVSLMKSTADKWLSLIHI